MAKRRAWREELDRWAAGPQAVVDALGDKPAAARHASRVRFVRGPR